MLGSSVSNHRRTSQLPVKELADIALRTAIGHADEPARATLFWEQGARKQTIAPNDSLLSISRPVPCASVAPKAGFNLRQTFVARSCQAQSAHCD